MHLTGLVHCVVDPPDPRYPYAKATSLGIDVHGIDFSKAPPLPQELPSGAFSFRFWVSNWNAFFCVAAKDARLDWRDTGGWRHGPLAAPATAA